MGLGRRVKREGFSMSNGTKAERKKNRGFSFRASINYLLSTARSLIKHYEHA